MYKDKKIIITVSYKNLSHYRKLYGENLKNKDVIEINISDLSENSKHNVTMICDSCGTEKIINYCNSYKNGEYTCIKCRGKKIKKRVKRNMG